MNSRLVKSSDMTDEETLQVHQERVVAAVGVLTGLNNVSPANSTSAAFLALQFVGKQKAHTDSLLALGDSMDCHLVLRTMIEGWSQICWVFEGLVDGVNQSQIEAIMLRAQTRADLWRNSWGVSAFREMRHLKRSELPREVWGKWGDWFDEHGATYLNKPAKKRKPDRDTIWEIAKPFVLEWNDMSIRATLPSFCRDGMYDWVYSPMSQWAHWDARTIAQASQRSLLEGGRMYRLTTKELIKIWRMAANLLCDTGKLTGYVCGLPEVNQRLVELDP